MPEMNANIVGGLFVAFATVFALCTYHGTDSWRTSAMLSLVVGFSGFLIALLLRTRIPDHFYLLEAVSPCVLYYIGGKDMFDAAE